jgi:hypothetical protein
MKASRIGWIVGSLLLCVVAATGQDATGPVDLHAEIQTVYNFQPHTLNEAQIGVESVALDEFWKKAKSQRDVYVPALRHELADFSNPPYFLFDGSELLRRLSNDPADRKIILAAIAHSDLRDLQLKDYFLLVQYMAVQGEDTTVAAFHVLAQPKFQVFIPQHALTLAQNYCLVYMLLPTNQDFWIQPAMQRLRAEPDVTAQKSLLLLLLYAQTPESDKAVAEFSSDPSKPEASKSYAGELVQRSATVRLAAHAIDVTGSEESLRQARRERMQAVSDEALEDLDSYTAKIIAKRTQPTGSRKI